MFRMESLYENIVLKYRKNSFFLIEKLLRLNYSKLFHILLSTLQVLTPHRAQKGARSHSASLSFHRSCLRISAVSIVIIQVTYSLFG